MAQTSTPSQTRPSSAPVLVHPMLGIGGRSAGRTFAAARHFLIFGGISYLALMSNGLKRRQGR